MATVNYFEQLYYFGTMQINDNKLKSIINCLIHNFRIEYSLRKLEKFTFCNWRLCCILKMNCHNLLAKLFWVWAIIILKKVIYALQSFSVLSNHIKFFNDSNVYEYDHGPQKHMISPCSIIYIFFFFFFSRYDRIWTYEIHSMIIVLYHYVKLPISFWCK